MLSSKYQDPKQRTEDKRQGTKPLERTARPPLALRGAGGSGEHAQSPKTYFTVYRL